MALSDTIKERREQLKISQIDLAEMAGVSLATVKDIERGKGNPTLQTLERILAVLGMEVVYQLRQTIQEISVCDSWKYNGMARKPAL